MNNNATIKLTPMMKQWQQAKDLHKDAILLFRMGDFYELFDQDAIIAAPILDLTLTSRDKDKPKNKMAGFPFHAVDGYIRKLLEHGHKVAICEQLEDPKNKVLVVKRGVTNVITPGTALDNELTSCEGAFLVGVVCQNNEIAVCSLDYSTSAFKITSSRWQEKIIEEILRISPKEIIIDDLDFDAQNLTQELKLRLDNKSRFEQRCSNKINKFSSLDGLGFLSHERAAAELVLSYVLELKGQIPPHITLPSRYSIEQHVLIDEISRINLDLMPKKPGDKCNLYSVLDDTKTAMGKRCLFETIKAPLTSVYEITKRQALVDELLLIPGLRIKIRDFLGQLYDLDRLVALLSSGKISPRSMGNLRDSVVAITEIKTLIQQNKGCLIDDLISACPDLSLLVDRLTRELAIDPPLLVKDGGIFKSGVFDELDSFKNLAANAHKMLLELEARERQKTAIPSLKVKYTRVFGYYIEITKTHLEKVPNDYFRKQTVANGERFTTKELTFLEGKINSADTQSLELENKLFNELCTFLLQFVDSLLVWSKTLALVDLTANFAELAHSRGYVKPTILETDAFLLDIKDGRHPVIEQLCQKQGVYFVPNSTRLDKDQVSLMLITGPNMAGKSTIMRQVALIQIMAQMGSYVPASNAELSVCDAIFARVGASDDPSTNRSTFMVEMTETAAILRNATAYSLIVLDEIGRGTSTYDGLSIAQAVAEYIHDHLQTKTLFATHYHELTHLEGKLSGLKNFHVKIDETKEGLAFLYTIVKGPCHKSFGIEVARLSGLPQTVLNRALAIVTQMEQGKSISITKSASGNHWQLNLFGKVVEQNLHVGVALVEKIKGIDINKMTPLEAINQLAMLKNVIISAI